MSTSFPRHVPRIRFILRTAPVALLLGVGGFLAVGVTTQFNFFHPKMRAPATLFPAELRPAGASAWSAAGFHYRHLIAEAFNLPLPCRVGIFDNSLQKDQCADLQEDIFTSSLLASLPFALILGFWAFGLDRLVSVYQRIRKITLKNPAQAAAKVTLGNRSIRSIWKMAKPDGFCYFFCFRKIQVKLASGHALDVYVSRDIQTPKKGQPVLLFSTAEVWGKKRWVAVPVKEPSSGFSNRLARQG